MHVLLIYLLTYKQLQHERNSVRSLATSVRKCSNACRWSGGQYSDAWFRWCCYGYDPRFSWHSTSLSFDCRSSAGPRDVESCSLCIWPAPSAAWSRPTVESISPVTATETQTHTRYCCSSKGAITSKIKHAIKLKTSPARIAQLLQPSLAFCFSLQPMTAQHHAGLVLSFAVLWSWFGDCHVSRLH